MIHFDHVSKQFGSQTKALNNVSVEIKGGEFVFLIGPSGAGKTTLLRLLMRDILPSHGKIVVDNWEVNKLHPSKIFLLRRKIGMVFQDFKLLLDRTVFENVALGLEILGKPRKDIEKEVTDVLALVGLFEKKSLFPAQLSSGEMQRTSIARAIVGGPKILLADEPTGNLDPHISWEIIHILQEINKIGTTVLMTTHNATIVNDLKKRTITIDHGEITSDEISGRYHVAKKERT